MQQINFYLEEFQPSREPFRSSHLLVVSTLLLALLIAITFKTASDNKLLASQIETDRKQVQDLKDQLQKFMESKKQINIVELDNRIVQIKQEIAKRQQLLQVISYQDLGNDRGFSSHLEVMARQSNPKISLEVFSIHHGGNYLELVGKTTSADQVPAYIRSLKSETVFKDVRFGTVQIEPVKIGSPHLQFVLGQPETASKIDKLSAVQTFMKDQQKQKGLQP